VADPHDLFPACDVCGRTILKGEQIHEYLTPQRERIRVCVLCRSRAESSGWIPVSMAHTLEEEQPRRSRTKALRQRFGRAASRARSAARSRREPEPARGFEAPEGDVERPPARQAQAPEAHPAEPQPEPAPEPEPRPAAEPTPPAVKEQPPAERRPAKPAPPREPRPRTATRTGTRAQKQSTGGPRRTRAKRGPEALMRRGVERFNSSEERRKVAGLMRSLGEPHAGVRPDPRRQLALVTVAWELSWYQWEVEAEGDDDSVREVAKGAEVSELEEGARVWNAVVDEDGTLRLRSAAERQRQEAASEA
jgi:hypothetical protein